jgi:hypothetical protein
MQMIWNGARHYRIDIAPIAELLLASSVPLGNGKAQFGVSELCSSV